MARLETINITPSWRAAASVYCQVLQEPGAPSQVKLDATRELLRMAAAYDRLLDEWKDIVENLERVDTYNEERLT